RYILQRLGTVVPTVFGITLVIFLMIHLIPGDAADVLLGMSTTPEAAAALRRMFGLDQPLHVQYLTWIGAILHGDLGTSLRTGHRLCVRACRVGRGWQPPLGVWRCGPVLGGIGKANRGAARGRGWGKRTAIPRHHRKTALFRGGTTSGRQAMGRPHVRTPFIS